MADNMITNESGTVHTIKVKFGLCGPQGPKGEKGDAGPQGLPEKREQTVSQLMNWPKLMGILVR